MVASEVLSIRKTVEDQGNQLSQLQTVPLLAGVVCAAALSFGGVVVCDRPLIW